jgi:hypothetical protein
MNGTKRPSSARSCLRSVPSGGSWKTRYAQEVCPLNRPQESTAHTRARLNKLCSSRGLASLAEYDDDDDDDDDDDVWALCGQWGGVTEELEQRWRDVLQKLEGLQGENGRLQASQP